MLNNDEAPRSVPPQQSRRPLPTRFQDNRFSSPSSNYNFNSNSGYNQTNGFGAQQQHPRRRIDRFKRETINYSDRLIRQNDSIIRLLKEIRDRLPAPPPSAVVSSEPDQNGQEGSGGAVVQENSDAALDGIDQSFDRGSETGNSFEGQDDPQQE